MSQDITSIILDFGGVIIDIQPELSWNAVSDLLSDDIPPDVADGYIQEINKKYERGAISTELFINYLLRYAESRVQARDILDAWDNMLLGISSDQLITLKQLKSRYKLYLLSNTNDLHMRWVRHHLSRDHGISDWDEPGVWFDQTYYSYLMKMRKPDPDIYQTLLTQQALRPEQTLFVDDNADNCSAAASIGIETILKDPQMSLEDSLSAYL